MSSTCAWTIFSVRWIAFICKSCWMSHVLEDFFLVKSKPLSDRVWGEFVACHLSGVQTLLLILSPVSFGGFFPCTFWVTSASEEATAGRSSFCSFGCCSCCSGKSKDFLSCKIWPKVSVTFNRVALQIGQKASIRIKVVEGGELLTNKWTKVNHSDHSGKVGFCGHGINSHLKRKSFFLRIKTYGCFNFRQQKEHNDSCSRFVLMNYK